MIDIDFQKIIKGNYESLPEKKSKSIALFFSSTFSGLIFIIKR